MNSAAELSHQARPNVGVGQTVRDNRSTRWRLLMAIGATGLVLQLPLQAKPIEGCLVQQTDLLDPASCLAPPVQLTSTRSASQTIVVAQPDKVARVTLDNLDTGSGSAERSGGERSSFNNCSALRGTHEAQSLMLQTVQSQLSNVDRNRRAAKVALNSLRSSGADERLLTSAATRLTKINAVWSSLRGDVEARTKSFNSSMSRLTKACLRG